MGSWGPLLVAVSCAEVFKMPGAVSPLRILCLHGFGQSRERIADVSAPLTKFLPEVTWMSISAPHRLPPLGKGASTREHRCWFWYNEKERGDLTNMLSAPTYYGLDVSLQVLRDEIREKGINGLFGFSQGAVLVHAATQDKEIGRQLRVAILVGGFAAKPLPLRVVPEIRTLHVFSRCDNRVPAKRSLALAARYANCRVLMHWGGHSVPSSNAVRSAVRDFLLQAPVQSRMFHRVEGFGTLPAGLQYHFLSYACLLVLITWVRRFATRCRFSARTSSQTAAQLPLR